MQAMRHPGKLSIASGLRYGFAISWIVSGIGLIFFIVSSDSSPIRLFLELFALLILVLVPFLAYAAAVTTINALRGSQFDMLCVTALSDQCLIEGYILTSLYRFKGFLALLVGFTPLIVLWAAAISVYDCQFPSFCSSPNLMVFFITLVGFILLALNVIGICLFNTVVGLLLAVAFRSRIMSGLGALIVGLSLTPLYLWAASGREELFMHNLLLLPIFYVLSGMMIWRARPLVRKVS
jgi:hypothetical protein